MASDNQTLVSIIMGSKSDWDTMQAASKTLKEFDVPHNVRVLSAHRTPSQLMEHLRECEENGCEVFIGGAGGAAHLCGVIAAHTVRPVLGVPIESKLQGLDSLLSTVQMPGGIPVGTLAIGSAGATNAALLAVAILGNSRPDLHKKIGEYRANRAEKILNETLD
ncbi:MAG: 5-(carboxyamino)imidazole ribonucleotide mutase [Candidatus Hydrogenedentes bacterium]|nr:5-(carboxyamino)imidazole ribonucleotide mutase [Candidatus Hydrogenedentota bacterium]